MKNFIFSLILVVACVLTACGTSPSNRNTTSAPSTEPTSVTTSSEPTSTSVENFDPLALVAAYCDGTWDGSFIFNAEHCASIENGVLWIDCKAVDEIPDMGIYEDFFWTRVISSDEEGTWVQDRDLGTVSLWQKGTRIKEIRVDATYYTSVYKLASCLVVREGDFIQTWSLDGIRSNRMSQVVDCYLNEDGEVFCSNFEHKNFTIKEDGSFEEISSTYVRFPRSQSTLIADEANTDLREKISNLYINTDWEGNCKVLDNGVFVSVDFFSNEIVVNNKVIGNVSLPSNLNGMEKANLHFTYKQAYCLDGLQLRVFSEGKEVKSVDVPDGYAELLWIEDEFVVGQTYNGETNTLFIVRDKAYQIISESCVDSNVAYDTLYYMEGSTVYTLNTNDVNATPEVFFEGAYAVSQFYDEGEGAIVPFDEANFKCYGYDNIYSPFGD